MRASRSGHEEGSVFPLFLVALLVVFTSAVVLLHLGRAGDLRTRAQSAADAAALGAVAEIRGRALLTFATYYTPFAVYDETKTAAAADDYARSNGAEVTHIDYGGLFGHTVTVDVRTTGVIGTIQRFKALSGGHGTAQAIATVDFPNCFPATVKSKRHKPPRLIGSWCNGEFIPYGADVSRLLHLFRIHLVPKAPPKLGLTGPSSLSVGPQVHVNGPAINLCAKVAQEAGFSGRSLVVAVAIAMAESSCNPTATNANSNSSVDYGLWQINTVHGLPVSCLFDPLCNAKAAYDISSGGTNFYPWCTYDYPACGGAGQGAYRQYLGAAQEAVGRLG